MINITDLLNFVKRIKNRKLIAEASNIALYNATEFIKSESIKPSNTRWKKRTGVLGQSVSSRVNRLTSEIFIDLGKAPYGEYVYNGWERTAPILPRNKKALSFVVGGSRIFAGAVNSSAKWKADPFILNTFNKRRERFISIFQNNLSKELDGVL